MNSRRSRIATLVLLLCIAGPQFARGQEKPLNSTPLGEGEMDLATFRAELDRLSTTVEHLGADLQEVEKLRRSQKKSWAVRVVDERYDVPMGWLDAKLESYMKEPGSRDNRKKEIHGRLQALLDQAAALEKIAPGPAGTSARAAMEKILKQAEFSTVAKETWWNRAQARFWRWLVRVLDRIFGSVGRVAHGRDILVWIVIGIAFVLLVMAGRKMLLRAARSESMRIEAARPAGKTWNAWAQEALRAAAKGDYRKAVHAAYWAGVFRLADLGAWELQRSRTPREYLRILKERKSPLVAPSEESADRVAALASLTQRFETTWYGFEAATEVDFRDALSQLEALGCRFPSSLATAKS